MYQTFQYSKKIEKYQTEALELKNIIAKLKNTLKRFNSRLDEAKKESMIWKTGQWNSPKQSSKKNLKSEDSLRDLGGSIKWSNIWIVDVSGEEREKGTENLFEEVMAENTPNLRKETDVCQNGYQLNTHTHTHTHITNVGKDVEKRELPHTGSGNVNWCMQPQWKTVQFLKKLNWNLTI